MTFIPIVDRRRVRRIDGGFGFIPHRFVNDGFFASLDTDERSLYFFLTVVSDRYGMSWYGQPALQKQTGLSLGELDAVRRRLEAKDLIASRPPVIQVLSLPPYPVKDTDQTDTLHLFTHDDEPQDGGRP